MASLSSLLDFTQSPAGFHHSSNWHRKLQ